MSDPGHDAAGTGLRDGLVLRAANNGPSQQFCPQPNGTLNNAATGLIVLRRHPPASRLTRRASRADVTARSGTR